MIIAIDGPSASGKGTLAHRLARALGFAHLDTGLLYRAVAAKLLEAGQAAGDPAAAQAMAEGIEAADLARGDLRSEAVGRASSEVAALPGVRAALLAFQRRFAARPPEGRAGAVLDGRDIGTVVCPEAEVKLFVVADVETRAQRRHKELLERGEASIYPRVLRDLQERDARDSERQAAPLRPADDATVLDTSKMDADAALEAALEVVAARRTGAEA